MSNEQYLIVSYFAVAAGSLVAGVATALLLRGPLKLTLAGFTQGLRRLMPRWLAAWCLLAVMLGFLSVSYIDCGHSSYTSIVNDRPHMENVSRAQASVAVEYLIIGVLVYTLALSIVLVLPWWKVLPAVESAPGEKA